MTESDKRGVPPGPSRVPAPRSAAASPCDQPGLSQSLAIGDLAREFDISTRAIRFYEARGLLHPARRGTARVFGPIDRQRLALIIRAKNLGLTLEEIGEHLAIYDADATDATEVAALKARTDRHIATLVGKRHDLQQTLKELRDIRLHLASCLARPRKQ
jgi:DNA-binding transcriptional MerR regulator